MMQTVEQTEEHQKIRKRKSVLQALNKLRTRSASFNPIRLLVELMRHSRTEVRLCK